MSNRSMTAVFDCMVYLQGAGSRHGPARQCLELVDSGQVKLYLTPPILLELADVLSRPITPEGEEFKRRFPALTILDPVSFLSATRAK